MLRITPLLVLGGILLAGCDTATPGQHGTGIGSRPEAAHRTDHPADAPATADDGGENYWKGICCERRIPLVTIGTILESFLPR